MASCLISVLQVFLYLILLVCLDVFAIIRKRRLAAAALWGAAVCAGLFFADSFVGIFKNGSDFAPLVEDALKFCFVAALLRSGKVVFPGDSFIYGATCGAGFALAENLIYAKVGAAPSLPALIYRGFATSLMHICATGLSAALLVILVKWRPGSFLARHKGVCAAVSLVPTVGLHYLHNSFILDPKLSLLAVVSGSAVLVLLLFKFDRKQVHDWMEVSVNDEVRMARAFKAGKFETTSAGRYLLSVREQFKPEVFFDMVVYVRLYLSISLSSKGFLMMREQEVEIPREGLEKFRWEVGEFRCLRRSIGRMGVYALSPIVDHKRADSIAEAFL